AVIVFTRGGLLESLSAEVGSAVPDEPVAVVVTLFVAPKSGFGRRLLPVRGTWESAYPPRTTKLFCLPKVFGLHANARRGSRSVHSMGVKYLDRPPRPAYAKGGTSAEVITCPVMSVMG